ncbi:hypothetical protein FACS189429_8000 [Bacteroidia bacterium]|nr:hypothetical protein FACS189429_8000 [Bacteroidia bacterium]
MLFCSIGFSNAQNWKTYVQFGAGYCLKGGFAVESEIGESYKWMDFGLSFAYTSTLPSYKADPAIVDYPRFVDTYDLFVDKNNEFSGKTGFGIIPNVKLDIIRLFTATSRHSFKIGGGYGFFQNTSVTKIFNRVPQHDTDIRNSLSYHLSYTWDLYLQAAYSFNITNKISVGAFYKLASDIDAVGVQVRYDL